VEETAFELIEELGAREIAEESAAEVAELAEAEGVEPHEAVAAAIEAPRARALCIPLRDEGDKIAAQMLGQMLEAAHLEPIQAPVEALTTEIVDLVEAEGVDLVVVSVLPPLPQNDSRLLCRRLRKRYPQLPIIVGYWAGSTDDSAQPILAAKGDGEVVTTLADAVERARAIASRAPTIGGASSTAVAEERPLSRKAV
jgi:CheY-like chemotaxis protein